MIPAPRQPTCTRHLLWMASCSTCTDQRRAQREKQGAS